MRVGIASDHGGFELKEKIVGHLCEAGQDVIDFGAEALTVADDYPDFVVPLAHAVAEGRVERGIAICESLEGIGSATLFAMRLIMDAFRAPFEVAYIRQEVADQGWRSLPLIISSGMALGFVMTLHTRKELIRFGASAWIPTLRPYHSLSKSAPSWRPC